ncbi:MAG TPA: rhodanese-like domain-containing protein [Acidimicrobiales bacterium]
MAEAGSGAVDGPASAAIDRLLDGARVAIEPRAEPGDLAGVLERGGLVVDIRPVELRERDGLIPGALVVGRNVLEWRLDPTSPHRLPEVRGRDQEMVIVCDEGYASSLAAATLRQLGLGRVTDLAGGFQAWRREAEAGRIAVPAVTPTASAEAPAHP